jgi:hypothetical protein
MKNWSCLVFGIFAFSGGCDDAVGEDTDVVADTDEGSDTDGTDDTADGGTNSCVYPLVKLRTGKSDTCMGGNEHHWPIGMDAADCHGWAATDTDGNPHENSANDIRCNADGSFQFTQFAGSLSCEGSGVTKVYTLNECTQDIPPMLYTEAFDLTCCSAPESAECESGLPSVSVGDGTITLNGELCEP